MPKALRPSRIESFDFKHGMRISKNYEIVKNLGKGWEGEVYLVKERTTGIERAAKFFFPQRNLKNRAALINATKLHKLRKCPTVVAYHSQEFIRYHDQDVSMLITEYLHGEILFDLLQRQPGKKLDAFSAIHLLYALAVGIEQVHNANEYHGDLHSENIMVEGFGLHFHLKILDLFYWQAPKKDNRENDLCNMIQIFHEALGGARTYPRQRPEIKEIICGLKRSLIIQRFRTVGGLKNHLELMRWKL